MYGNAIQDLFTRGLDWQTGSVLAMFLLARRRVADGALRTLRAGAERGGLMEIRRIQGGRCGCCGSSSCCSCVFLYAPIVILALFSFNDGDVSFPLAGVHDALVRASSSTTPS